MENVVKLSMLVEEYSKKQNEFWGLQMKAKKEFDEERRKIQETFLREYKIEGDVTLGDCNYYPKQKLIIMRIYGRDVAYIVYFEIDGKLQKVQKSTSGEAKVALCELPHCVWQAVDLIQNELKEKGFQKLSKKIPFYLETSTILYQ